MYCWRAVCAARCTYRSGRGGWQVILALHFHQIFRPILLNFIPLEEQNQISFETFQSQKEKYMGSEEHELKLLEMAEDSDVRGYFLTNRNFKEGLIAPSKVRKNGGATANS